MIEPRILIFVRHAEREPIGSDPVLTEAGRERARQLVRMLRDAGVTDIFTSTYRRTQETAEPLAAALQLVPKVVADDPDEARTQLLGSGNCIVVIGHTDTIPALIAKIGGPTQLTIGDDEFDRFFALTIINEQAALIRLRY